MKVFVVIRLIDTKIVDFSYNVVGVYTSLKKAQERMKECHNKLMADAKSIYDCKITDNVVDDTQCLLVYKIYDTPDGVEYKFMEERHLVVIEEREVED